MDTKLIAALACAAALALGACSGGNPPAGSDGTDRETPELDPNDPNPNDDNADDPDDDNGDSGSTELERLRDGATRAIARARNAAPGERARVETEIENARKAIDDAVKAADAAYKAIQASASATPTAQLAAYDRYTRLLALQRTQTPDLEDVRDSLAWYGRNLVRYELASGEAAMPREGVNTATVVKRIPRTIPNVDNLPAPPLLAAAGLPQNRNTQIPNPKRFDADTFKTVMYEDGNRVFSVVDDGEGGDEFRVDGYVTTLVSRFLLDPRIYTGLKLTDDGLVIRTGGTANLGTDDYNSDDRRIADYTDMRRDITRFASDSSNDGIVTPFDSEGDGVYDGIRGQNGWDLEITFDEPQTRSVPVDFDDISNPVSSWTGNNAFYWRAIAPADPSQLDEDGDNYKANAFNQPKGYRDLGTYEVWLSNHVGVDRKREPAPGRTATCPVSGKIATSCPEDDDHRYLEYAAYGLFVYTASTETFRSAFNGHAGRINTLHFGYSAFGTGEGQTTEDIGETITGGKFHGYALAYEVLGDNNLDAGSSTGVETKLLRGDVALTVNIPKESGRRGTVEGTINNFQQWHSENKYWTAYVNNFTVALNSASIGENGAFSGFTQATPANTAPNRFNPATAPGQGHYKGSFYGPRADAEKLEVAGSWTVGTRTVAQSNPEDRRIILGSFGAKQKPPATPESD